MVTVAEAPIISAARNAAEKYINQRTQEFTRRHAKRMQEFMDTRPGATEEQYYTAFRAEAAAAAKNHAQLRKRIDGDTTLSFREKQAELNRAGDPASPYWDQNREDRFIATYGDPMQDTRIYGLLEDHKHPTTFLNAMREGTQVEVKKVPWEQKFYEALVNPQDGSVPLRVPGQSGVLLEASDAPEPQAEEPQQEPQTTPVPIVALGPVAVPELPQEAPDNVVHIETVSTRHAEAVAKAAKKVCKLCLEYFPGGVKPSHVDSSRCRATAKGT